MAWWLRELAVFVEDESLVQGSAMLEDAHLVLNSRSEVLYWLLDTFMHMHAHIHVQPHPQPPTNKNSS